MSAITSNLAESVAAEGSVVQFLVDHDVILEKLSAIHRKQAAELEQSIAATRKSERQTIAAFKAEIARIEAEIADVEDGAARKIAADQKTLGACRAFLQAAE